MDKVSYALGLNIGQQLKQMGLKDSLVVADFAASINDILQGNDLKVSLQEANGILQKFFEEQENRQKEAAREAGKAAREEGEKFLAENAKKPGVLS